MPKGTITVRAQVRHHDLSWKLVEKKGMKGKMLTLMKRILLDDGEGTKAELLELKKLDLLEQRAEICEEFGWSHFVEFDEHWMLLSAPDKFACYLGGGWD
jgi:hypothetical protein